MFLLLFTNVELSFSRCCSSLTEGRTAWNTYPCSWPPKTEILSFALNGRPWNQSSAEIRALWLSLWLKCNTLARILPASQVIDLAHKEKDQPDFLHASKLTICALIQRRRKMTIRLTVLHLPHKMHLASPKTANCAKLWFDCVLHLAGPKTANCAKLSQNLKL